MKCLSFIPLARAVNMLAFAASGVLAAESLFAVALPPRQARTPDGYWDPRFALPPGVDGEVLCATFYRGDLYVGGRFTKAGNVTARGLARWDGQDWWPVRDGIEGTVATLTVFANSLYVGGQFRTLGPESMTNIVRLTRHGWEALGDGIPFQDLDGQDQYVNAVAVRGRNVYAAGRFRVVGGRSARNIAQWDGQRWLGLDEGIGRDTEFDTQFGEVHALAVIGRNLYAGGLFDRAGSVWATNIARWDGDRWRPLDAGLSGGSTGFILFGGVHSGQVSALAVQSGQLVAGGDFSLAGTRALTNLARWNGRRWLPLAGGVHRGAVRDVVTRGAELFVAGTFEQAGKVNATNVARWDGRRWTALESGVRGYASALALRGRDLYVGGYFGLAGHTPAAFVARWNRAGWSALAPTPSLIGIPGWPVTLPGVTNAVIGDIRAMGAAGNDVYVGGAIWSAGLLPVENIARWNGTNWSALGGGLPGGSVHLIAVDGTNVFVAGAFTLPAVGATNLALWDGARWSAIGGGLHYDDIFGGNSYPALISSMTAGGGRLYVAGSFNRAGSVEVAGLAAWDGTNWTALESTSPDTLTGLFPGGNVLAFDGSRLYAAGIFSQIGGTTATNIAQWDSASWSPLAGGLSAGTGGDYFASPRALAVFGTNLYVAGERLSSDQFATATNVLCWDGAAWTSPGLPTVGAAIPLALASSPTQLFIGGAFTNVAGQTVGNVVRWDGTNYSSMSGGVLADGGGAYVSSLAHSGGKLCVAGRFTSAGGSSAFNFGIWSQHSFTVPSPPFPGLANFLRTNLPPREVRSDGP